MRAASLRIAGLQSTSGYSANDSKKFAVTSGRSSIVDEAPAGPPGQVAVDHFRRRIAPSGRIDQPPDTASSECVPHVSMKKRTSSLLRDHRWNAMEKQIAIIRVGKLASEKFTRSHEVDELTLTAGAPQVQDAP